MELRIKNHILAVGAGIRPTAPFHAQTEVGDWSMNILPMVSMWKAGNETGVGVDWLGMCCYAIAKS